MNDDEFVDMPSGFMLGKEFMIVLVIIFSGLSFTLGYFVGKSGVPKPEPALQAVESIPQEQKQELLPVAPALASAPGNEQAVLPPIKEQESPIPPVTDAPAQPKSTEAQTSKPPVERSAGKILSAADSENTSVTYTVQIGAFKNPADAKLLKAKFDKKGYKSFISEGRNKKAEKIFKVKTGEFREKKEAEVLALKLKKAEGLQTYVTMKKE